ncbi:MAG: hypothetical protein R2932_57590 [Caldilineaceae bacterium]
MFPGRRPTGRPHWARQSIRLLTGRLLVVTQQPLREEVSSLLQRTIGHLPLQ